MKITETQLRTIVRNAMTELFVRPKHRKSFLRQALDTKYQGPEYGGDPSDPGFGEFEEGNTEKVDDSDEINTQDLDDSEAF
ncbi:MAG TPA: hypothetical protein EYM86_03010 [Flavobacteriales bacterium]|nr:hypothetical protein [Flavobacteriales bacterium]